jgi:polyisoprenoid-binding protein YceI
MHKQASLSLYETVNRNETMLDRILKTTVGAVAGMVMSTAAMAQQQDYVLDASHSQILFSYNHLGFSTTWNMFSGFDGKIGFDESNPANSSVAVSFPLSTLFTGWEARFKHFMSPDFFGPMGEEVITFTSTGIEVTGDNTAKITGDLVINGETKSVVLDAVMNQRGDHPMAGKPWMGFNATTTLLRSDFGLGKFAPFVGDELDVMISIEAMAAN